MYKKLVSAMYLFNIVLQSIFNLLFPIGICFFACWLLVNKLGCPEFLYVIFILLGTFSGLVMMVKFIISATRALDAIEKQNEDREEDNNEQ